MTGFIAGPLPTLDGITNNKQFISSSFASRTGVGGPGPGPGGSGSPQIMTFPAVDEEQVREFKTEFWKASPVNGFLSGTPKLFQNYNLKPMWRYYCYVLLEEKVMNAYIMTSNLSYEDIREIM